MSELLVQLRTALAETYNVESMLGEGGMAVVMLATDRKHNRKVAIKVLRPELSRNLGADRFLQEIETAAGLSHPHILPVHDSGEADGLLYYVMPFVEGEALSDRIAREQQLPIEDAVRLAQEAAEALSHAHSMGIVHRDVKPDNVMLYGGHAVIADFGIAKAVSEAGGERLTGVGMSVGTPAYISPEQALGEDVDARSDVYSLGCMLYEMLTGETPFSGRTAQSIIQQHVTATPPSADAKRPSTPTTVAAAIRRAMAKAPADRYATASEFAQALELPADATGAFMATAIVRKLPLVLGTYVVAAVAVFFLLEFLVNRLVWSPYLPAFGLSTMLLALPAVAAIGYRRTVRTIMLPANLAVAAVVLWLAFGSRDLGAATRSVVVEDEDGNQIERVVPKSEFRKRFALFYFDNASGNPELDWVQYGLPLAVDLDLDQDLFVQAETPESQMEDLRRAGHPTGLNLPFPLMRELADDRHFGHVVSGSFDAQGDEFTVTVRLYETRRGRLVSERTHVGTDLMALADGISVQLREDLEVPSQHMVEAEDLPVQDLMSTSSASFRSLTEAYRSLFVDDDWQAAATSILASVEADPTNAYAHTLRYVISLLGNDPQGAAAGLQGAMQHIYRLPERLHYAIKMGHYEFNRQPDKQLAVAEMWVDVFPDDLEGREMLTRMYDIRRNRDGMIAQLEAILELDPLRFETLRRIGAVYQAQGEFDRATEYFARYAEQFPDDADAYMSLGRLLQLQGEFAEARAQFERALLIEPTDVGAQLALSLVARREGNFADEVAQLADVLDGSGTAQDSARTIAAMRAAHMYRGQVVRALTLLQQQLALQATFNPPVAVLLAQLGSLDSYVAAGQEAQARQTLEAVRAQLAPPWDAMIPVGELALALEVEDADAAEAAIVGVEQFIAAFGVENLRPAVMHGTAKVRELRGQYSEAEAAYEAEIAAAPTDLAVHIDLARVRRLEGDLDGAERALRRALTAFPNSPTAHYQMALIEEQRGNSVEAVEHLRRSLTVWSDADEAFAPAREARERLAALGGSM